MPILSGRVGRVSPQQCAWLSSEFILSFRDVGKPRRRPLETLVGKTLVIAARHTTFLIHEGNQCLSRKVDGWCAIQPRDGWNTFAPALGRYFLKFQEHTQRACTDVLDHNQCKAVRNRRLKALITKRLAARANGRLTPPPLSTNPTFCDSIVEREWPYLPHILPTDPTRRVGHQALAHSTRAARVSDLRGMGGHIG